MNMYSKKPQGCIRAGGFSLFELLVVIFIIGMIMTFAALSVGGSADQKVEEEAKRLTALMRLAMDEAVMNSRDMVLILTLKNYSFAYLSAQNEIVPVDDKEDPTFRARELSDDILFKDAEIAGESVSLTIELDDSETPPMVYIYASGEMIPFKLTLGRDDGGEFDVEGTYAGEVNYARKDTRR